MSRAASPLSHARVSCPLCRKPASADHAPFCSQGCRDRDLLNWLGDAYKSPGPPADEGVE
ncbi:MAG: uncharacterized protein QOH81_1674 [Sphingomonadales bacterium]|jgi:endogenous inhibitor of DNA gyrase (YacG/DUF329 family)|nr:uncharacterized protein [Sphingomonadales bacterium]